eukprot:scaffold7349_cov173-Amphora_coffeaeformis.AAC.86
MNRIAHRNSVTKRLYHSIVYKYGGSCSIYRSLVPCTPARFFSSPPPSPPATTSPTGTVPSKNDEGDSSNNDLDKYKDMAQRGKSILNAFVHQTSKRAERRRLRLARLRKRYKTIKASPAAAKEEEDEPWVDNRSIRELLFPMPYDMMEDPMRQPKRILTIKDYIRAAREAWELYIASWRGFWTSGMIVRDPLEEPLNDAKSHDKKDLPGTGSKASDASKKKDEDDDMEHISPSEAKRRLRKNVRRNAKLLRKGALRLREEVRDRTGIRTAEDVKRISAEIMTLVSECLQEFLAGYREGRDGQVRQMLEEDLRQQQEEQAKAATGGDEKPPTRRRRRPKRRILRR